MIHDIVAEDYKTSIIGKPIASQMKLKSEKSKKNKPKMVFAGFLSL